MILRLKAILFAGCLMTSWACLAADDADVADALPEPLTLDYALSLVDARHPDLLAAAADTDIARAQRDRAASAYGVNAGLNAEAMWIEPAERSFDQSQNDSSASLYLSKRLYDFGRTRANIAAADAQLNSQLLQYTDAQQQHQLTILERYLDVLRADLEFRVQDEVMAIAYVQMDRARDRQELGQVSDIERLAAETLYQEARSARYQAQAEQRTRRVRLAEALNRPGQLSSALAEPDLQIVGIEPPDLADLSAEVLQNNSYLQALRAGTEAARERLQASRALDRPIITGRAEANEYERHTGSSDPWSVGVQLEVPLYTGGRSSAERALARAELQRSKAELARAELTLRQDVQSLWEEINVLRAGREEMRTRMDYRELYLDRSRTLYEMEVRTDLGDAMIVSSQARQRQAELEYHLLLNWARLNALRGQPLFAAVSIPADQEGSMP
jgi:outer membrane protein TolC